jgi:hypothetical protein
MGGCVTFIDKLVKLEEEKQGEESELVEEREN